MNGYMWLNLIVMAVVTYLIRMLPLAVFTRKIKSVFIKSFLFYIPYTVLSAMTFPAIFYSTDSRFAALVGTVVACVLAYLEKSLITVAVSACTAVFILEFFIKLI